MNNQKKVAESKINVVPELCVAAIRHRETAELICWTLIRHADSVLNDGQGSFCRTVAAAWLAEMLHVTKSRIRQILRSGMGKYWRKGHGSTLYITGMVSLLISLNVTELLSSYVVVPCYHLLRELTDVTGMLFAFAACKANGPIAIDVLAKECDKSSRTIQRRLHAASPELIITQNALEITQCDTLPEANAKLAAIRKEGDHPPWSLSIQHDPDDGFCIIRRMANSYEYGGGRRSYKRLRRRLSKRLGTITKRTICNDAESTWGKPVAVTHLKGITSDNLGQVTIWSDAEEEA